MYFIIISILFFLLPITPQHILHLQKNEEWFDYIISNRRGISEDDYDIVIGPVANDGTYEVINLYIRGIITKEQAIVQLKTYKLKDQYTFKTMLALNELVYKGVIE